MYGFQQIALLLIFTTAVILQFSAAVLAVRLMRLDRRGIAWGFVAAAFALMGIRRVLSFSAVAGGRTAGTPDLSVEFTALLVSILLTAGLLLLMPLMRTLYQAYDEIKTGRHRRADETRFRELFENIASGVMVYEPVDGGIDFVILDFNPAAEQIEKMNREHVIGRRVTDVFSGVEEFGLLEVLRRVSRSGKPERFPVQLYQNGRMAGWRDHFIYRRPCGEVVSVYEDMTEQMQLREEIEHREHKFRLFYEKAPLPYQSLDRNGRILEVNPAWMQMFGYKRREVIGQNFTDFMTPESLRQFRERQPQFETAECVSNVSCDLKKRDGTCVTVLLDGRMQRGPNGEVAQTYCILRPLVPTE